MLPKGIKAVLCTMVTAAVPVGQGLSWSVFLPGGRWEFKGPRLPWLLKPLVLTSHHLDSFLTERQVLFSVSPLKTFLCWLAASCVDVHIDGARLLFPGCLGFPVELQAPHPHLPLPKDKLKDTSTFLSSGRSRIEEHHYQGFAV